MSSLISFIPALAIFISLISKSSQLVILTMGGTFFWAIGMLVASIIWFIIPPLRTVYFYVIPLSVFCIEGSRYVFWFLYDKAYNHGIIQEETSKPSNFLVSIAKGWSFGISQAFIMHGSLIVHSIGPGYLSAPACPGVSLFYLNSLIVMIITLSQTFLGVIAFDAYKRKSLFRIAIVVGAHLTMSLFTLTNTKGGSCYVSVGAQFVILLGLLGGFWFTMVNKNALVEYSPINEKN